ncbi:hypothetical protein RND71_038182 [Anisodus tanguticus]|uniref:Uncharacterized protein n=1 Tax=Anisodus tanguticus TaxID=243964 RepID=A0AAE1QZJ5_9SOLA|nr:hypothetical protein RND71_038182 [Anisodus tanguticus]
MTENMSRGFGKGGGGLVYVWDKTREGSIDDGNHQRGLSDEDGPGPPLPNILSLHSLQVALLSDLEVNLISRINEPSCELDVSVIDELLCDFSMFYELNYSYAYSLVVDDATRHVMKHNHFGASRTVLWPTKWSAERDIDSWPIALPIMRLAERFCGQQNETVIAKLPIPFRYPFCGQQNGHKMVGGLNKEFTSKVSGGFNAPLGKEIKLNGKGQVESVQQSDMVENFSENTNEVEDEFELSSEEKNLEEDDVEAIVHSDAEDNENIDLSDDKDGYGSDLLDDEPFYDSSDADNFDSESKRETNVDRLGILKARKKDNSASYDSTLKICVWQLNIIFGDVKKFRKAINSYETERGCQLEKIHNDQR